MPPPERPPATTDEELLGTKRRQVKATRTEAERVDVVERELETGFEALRELGPAVSFFGSARTPPGAPFYELARVLEGANFHGKRSTPYAPGAVHDYMHAKVTVADDVLFVGSFNLSRSGELNAENVLEIVDAGLADQVAAFVDAVRARYADVTPPHLG